MDPATGDLLIVRSTPPTGLTEEAYETWARAEALRGQALPANGLSLLVTLQLFGELGSGRDVESNEATFPITVFNSGTTSCPAGQVPLPSGPCNSPGGQDGAPICGVPPTT